MQTLPKNIYEKVKFATSLEKLSSTRLTDAPSWTSVCGCKVPCTFETTILRTTQWENW